MPTVLKTQNFSQTSMYCKIIMSKQVNTKPWNSWNPRHALVGLSPFRACKIFQIILLDKIIPFIHAKIDICKSLTISVRNNGRRRKKSTIAMARIYVFTRVGFWSNRASRFTPWLPKIYATGHCTQTVVNNRPPKAKKLENEDQKNVRRGYGHKIMLKEKPSLQVVILYLDFYED